MRVNQHRGRFVFVIVVVGFAQLQHGQSVVGIELDGIAEIVDPLQLAGGQHAANVILKRVQPDGRTRLSGIDRASSADGDGICCSSCQASMVCKSIRLLSGPLLVTVG